MATSYAISPSRTTVVEADGTISVSFTVTRSGTLPAETLYASTVQGTANGFSDNNLDLTDIIDQPLAFAAGETSKIVTVQIIGDDIAELDERFGLVIQRHTSDAPSTFLARATFTVYDDDQPLLTVPHSDWKGGDGDWTQVSTKEGPPPTGWYPAVPSLGVDAFMGEHGITVTYSLAGGAARRLIMSDNAASLANAGTIVMSGGSLELATGSAIGGFTQTGGLLKFDNAVVRPDNSLDFDHPDSPGTASTIALAMNQGAAGTIEVASGSLNLAGTSALAGTISGDGTLNVIGSATLASTADVTVAGLSLSGTGAQLTLDGDRVYSGTFTQTAQTTILLNGHTFTLTGQSALGGAVGGAGTLKVSAAELNGFTNVIYDGAVFEDTGVVNQNAQLEVGTGSPVTPGTVEIDAGATWNLTADVSIVLYDESVIDNAGLLAKTGGTGTSVISGPGTFDSTGTIAVETGTLQLSSSGTLGGHLTGAGALNVLGAYSLAAGTVADIAMLRFGGVSVTLDGDFSYGGNFQLSGVVVPLDLNGHTATLSGTSTFDPGGFGAYVKGPGTLDITGTATGRFLFGGSVEFDVAGTVASSTTQFAGGGTLNIGQTGIFNITGGDILAGGAAEIDNAGLLEKTGAGTSTISPGTVSNSGTIKAAAGVMVVNGAVANDGC